MREYDYYARDCDEQILFTGDWVVFEYERPNAIGQIVAIFNNGVILLDGVHKVKGVTMQVQSIIVKKVEDKARIDELRMLQTLED